MNLDELTRRIAPLREAPVELLAAAERSHGITFAEELREWVRLFERYELETVEPALSELRAPDAAMSLKTVASVDDSSSLAALIGLFTGTSIVAQQDELSYLAAWVPDRGGRSRVYHFHPDDWGLWPTDPCLLVRLYRLLQLDRGEISKKLPTGPEAEAEAAEIAALRAAGAGAGAASSGDGGGGGIEERLDPERLFPRVRWLAHLFLAKGGDWAQELAKAASIQDFERERPLIPLWPQLALYWLWSHAMFGNSEELAETLALTRDTASGLVAETRDLVIRLEEGRDVRVGLRTGSMFEAFREQLQDEAPAAILGASAKARRDARERAAFATIDEESRLSVGLEQIAEREAGVRKALELLGWLEQGGALIPAVLHAKTGLTVEGAIDRFVSLADHRFRPMVLSKLRQAARFGDTSPHATHGLLLAFQKLATSFEEFESVIGAAGTGNYGPRRQSELFRAYGRFADDRATERLAEYSAVYLADVESWEPKVPREAFLQLMSRDSPQTEELAARLLEKASFSGANAALAIAAAEALGRMRSTRGIAGLERALQRELGRVDDGSRTRIASALVACAGKRSRPFLEGLVRAKLDRWEAEEDRQGSYAYHHKDVACWLAALLPLAPRDEALIDKAREMLDAFRLELYGEKRPRRDVIYAVAAVLRGAGNGRVAALAEAVQPYATMPLREDRSTLGLGEMLQKLAREVLARL